MRGANQSGKFGVPHIPPERINDDKSENLRERGTLNPDPETVADDLFAHGGFFDARDIVQVKYEMLRRVVKDGQSVSEASRAFGFTSRQSFYTAWDAFEQNGMEGLLPQEPGPRQAHKLTSEVIEFIRQQRQRDPSIKVKQLAENIQECFRFNVHPRSIERALVSLREETDPSSVLTTSYRSESGHLEVDFEARKVRVARREVHLTPREFKLLQYLVSNAGHPVGHRELLEEVWGPKCEKKLSHLRVCVNQLRKKIEVEPGNPHYILTEPCLGYRFADDPG